MPKVTVIIPAYNAGDYIQEAVDSALGQSWPNLEVIVVDDGSTDGSLASLDIYNDTRLRVIRQENAGKSVAMNLAIAQATGDFYCILDADDRMHIDRVGCQAEALIADPELAAIFCGHELLVGGRSVAPRRRSKSREQCLRDIEAMRMPAHDPTGMYRLSMVRSIVYDPNLRIGQGFDYILQVGERWPLKVLEDCLYIYRISGNSQTTLQVKRRQEFVAKVLANACKRRNSTLDKCQLKNQEKRRSKNRIADNGISTHCLESAIDLRRQKRWCMAIKVGFFSAKLHPFDYHYYRAFVAALLPLPLLNWLRSTSAKR